MPLLVTGSVAIDSVKTPFGESKDCLGGSAVYFSMAASFFCPVRLVGVVGGDFGFDLVRLFEGRRVDLRGLQTRADSKTFRWTGSYHDTMEQASTDRLELNVLAGEPPLVPECYRDSDFVFLANTDPLLQHCLLDQLDKPKFVAADTMNCWIENRPRELKDLLKRIDCFFLNADEARLLTGAHNLVSAAREIVRIGPHTVVVKKGESGSLVWTSSGRSFVLPAYPADLVKDPTGAGDSFAGAFLGCLAARSAADPSCCMTVSPDFAAIKTAVACGTVVASFTIGDFSLGALSSLKMAAIRERLEQFKLLTSFETYADI